jgi:hypothetical protein
MSLPAKLKRAGKELLIPLHKLETKAHGGEITHNYWLPEQGFPEDRTPGCSTSSIEMSNTVQSIQTSGPTKCLRQEHHPKHWVKARKKKRCVCGEWSWLSKEAAETQEIRIAKLK